MASPNASPERLSPDLVRGSLDLMALATLAEGPAYGLAVQQRLRAASGGLVEANPGTLYPLLHRLEADGLIAADWRTEEGRRRKWYALTAAGRGKLTDRAAQWYAYAEMVRGLLEPAVGPPVLAPKPA
ncbi:PadR family transcriptional regulator [Alienimonas californiensis]|uniref:Lineage-specific thermal regulator protein n=1 Tax=Alienimonas californiensis TaxID=2527989 RepID=A0A517P5Q6_9PLAN|nr:helix-turn-helix transcriptional regulator [Alienimonas californiensis]QDT14710.1 lineage-specific thermal regulator protein [Alienimonas californiensis]